MSTTSFWFAMALASPVGWRDCPGWRQWLPPEGPSRSRVRTSTVSPMASHSAKTLKADFLRIPLIRSAMFWIRVQKGIDIAGDGPCGVKRSDDPVYGQ